MSVTYFTEEQVREQLAAEGFANADIVEGAGVHNDLIYTPDGIAFYLRDGQAARNHANTLPKEHRVVYHIRRTYDQRASASDAPKFKPVTKEQAIELAAKLGLTIEGKADECRSQLEGILRDRQIDHTLPYADLVVSLEKYLAPPQD